MVEAFPELAGLIETKSETVSENPLPTTPIPPISHYNSTNGVDESAQQPAALEGLEDGNIEMEV